MHRFAVVMVLAVLLTVPVAAQDPELTRRDPAVIDALLRSSCYCIGCGTEEIKQLFEARCKFVRWGAYPWINPVQGTSNPNYQRQLDSVFTRFAAFVTDYKAATSNQNVVEFVIPEIVTAGVENVTLGEFHQPLKDLNIVTDLPADYRFVFDQVRNPKFGDNHWNKDEGIERNGVPSLVTKPGRLWAAYLALRAIRAGAESIGFAQPQLRVNTSDDLEFMVRKVRRLRMVGRPPLLFGASATAYIQKGASTKPLSDFIDYAKIPIDIDAYKVDGTSRYVQRHTGERVPCQLVRGGDNGKLLPLTPEAVRLNHLCMIATNQVERLYSTDDKPGRSFDASNPYRLRVLMELDGSAKCVDPSGARVWYYEPDAGYTSTCHEKVRHALPTTMFYLSRSWEARGTFLVYMYELAKALTRDKGYGVYFPLLIRVDQNEMKFVLAQKDCPAQDTCTPACADKAWLRPTQVDAIKGCPSKDFPKGRFCDVYDKVYLARDCIPDFETIQTLLP